MIPSSSQIKRLHRAAMDASSWSELEERVFDPSDPLLEGLRFKSDLELFTLAVAGAHTLLTGKRRQKIACPIDFPATSIERDGICYHIHGISHDRTHKRIVRERFSKLENAMVESNLSFYYPGRAVDHSLSHELKYLNLLDVASMFGRMDILAGQARDLLSLRRRQKSIDDVFSYRCINMRVKDGSVIGSDISKVTLPDHLEHDSLIISSDISGVTLPDHLEHSWLEYHLSRGFDRACLLRSLAQTEYLTTLAHRMGVKDMHALVGLGHERQIAYFLDYPDRALEVSLRYAPNPLVHAGRRFRNSSAIMAGSVVLNVAQLPSSIEQGAWGQSLTSAVLAGVGAWFLSRLYQYVFTNKTYVKSLFSSMR